MDETNTFILLRNEPEALTMYKETSLKINNQLLNHDKSLMNESEYSLNKNKNKKNFNKIRIDKKLRTGSFVNMISSKTQQSLGFNHLSKGKTFSNLNKKENNNSKQVTFNITKKNIRNKNFYLTSTLNSIYNKNQFPNSNNSTKYSSYMIDLIHKKESELCLDLIKNLSEKGIHNAKNIGNNKEDNLEETNNLIELIKKFNFDNINNQKMIEDQIINDINNNSIDNNLVKSDLNSGNDLSISMTTNFKTNNNLFHNMNQNNKNINNINNSALDKNLNNSSIELKNNNSSIIQNSSNIINEKSKLIKSSSTNNISRIKERKNDFHSKSSRMDYFQNEINFHTGFVRRQKKLYNETFKLLRKRKIFNPKKIRKPKKEDKLSLPEIEEYKSIIKEIERRKRIKRNKSQKIVELRKEFSELDLKDKLVEELHNIYQNQKNTFLWDLHDNYGSEENKVKYDPKKEEINANIRNINSIRRKQNYFIDGYSIFNGKINKRLNDFNYVLGNKFYDKDQKKEKEEKFHKCVEDFENKLKKYKDDLFREHKFYNKIFEQNVDFGKDKNQENYQDENFNFDEKYIIK